MTMSSDDLLDAAANNPDSEDFDQAADDIEDADISTTQRFTATGYLIALFITLGVTILAGIKFGYIDPAITITATLSIGWILEYLVAGLVAAFLLFTGAMVLVAIPVSLSAALIRFAGGIAESGEDD
jgi:hypothetical protein